MDQGGRVERFQRRYAKTQAAQGGAPAPAPAASE
jgi:hypothetical protein